MKKMKVAGTPLDRRSKARWRRDEVVDTYKEGFTAKEVAFIYDINPMQVYRYLNYDKYLAQCRKDSANYARRQRNNSQTKSVFQENKKWSKMIHDEYIQYLIKCKNEFKPSAYQNNLFD